MWPVQEVKRSAVVNTHNDIRCPAGLLTCLMNMTVRRRIFISGPQRSVVIHFRMLVSRCLFFGMSVRRQLCLVTCIAQSFTWLFMGCTAGVWSPIQTEHFLRKDVQIGFTVLGALMSVSCECRVLSGRGLCDGLITRPDKTYRVWCVWVWSRNLDN